MTPLYCTVAEACRLMGVSRNTMMRGIAAGTVPHVRPGA